jgi:hypothetical protein
MSHACDIPTYLLNSIEPRLSPPGNKAGRASRIMIG